MNTYNRQSFVYLDQAGSMEVNQSCPILCILLSNGPVAESVRFAQMDELKAGWSGSD